MQTIYCAVALVLLAVAGFGQEVSGKPQDAGIQHTGAYYCPWTHMLDESGGNKELWFEGATRTGTMRVYFNRGGAGVVGLFYVAIGDWKPVFLGGVWRGGRYELAGESADQKPAGHLQGRVARGFFLGSWTPEGAKRREPLRLREVQKMGCDGGGLWKQFKDPDWPVSFSYPAAWHLERGKSKVVLTCPDPESMTTDRTVTIQQGAEGTDKLLGLERCGNVWKADCECKENERVFYCEPKATRLNGMTMLNLDEHEWRVYCVDGGYVGQGEGSMRVLLAGKRWVELIALGQTDGLVDRLLKSIQRNGAASKP